MARGPKSSEGIRKALRNLKPFREEETPVKRDQHGVGAITLMQPKTKMMAAEIERIMSGDTGSYVLQCDQIAVGLLAVALRRVQQIESFLDKAGTLTNSDGKAKPVVDVLIRLLKESRELCNCLGITPLARTRLGLNVAKTYSLAEELQKLQDDGGDDDNDDSDSGLEKMEKQPD